MKGNLKYETGRKNHTSRDKMLERQSKKRIVDRMENWEDKEERRYAELELHEYAKETRNTRKS